MDPFAPGDGRQFSIFGYLDTAADTQFVRISRVGTDATMSGAVDDPPMVATTDLQTGETVEWSDSIIVLDDRSLGLVYFASFDVQPSTTYRLDVIEGGGVQTRGFTTVPGSPGIIPGTPSPNRFGDLEQTVFWADIDRARDALVHYRVRSVPSEIDTTIVVSYPGLGEPASGGWIIGVLLERDFRIVRRFAESPEDDSALVLLDLSMSIEAPSDEWTATEDASNIENGTGFFASVGRFRESWSLDSTVVRALGFEIP